MKDEVLPSGRAPEERHTLSQLPARAGTLGLQAQSVFKGRTIVHEGYRLVVGGGSTHGGDYRGDGPSLIVTRDYHGEEH